MSELPEGVAEYRRTPTFDETSVPKALMEDHATKDGVWAKIVMEKGRLLFEQIDGGDARELAAADFVVVPPTVRHKVTPLGSVSFHVAFYR